MVTFRGGLKFPIGRPIRLPPPPETLPVEAVHLTCSERPEVHAGQIVRQGQVLLRPTRPGTWYEVSPISGTVRQVRPLAGSDDVDRAIHDSAEHLASLPELSGYPHALETARPPDYPDFDPHGRGYEVTIESAAARSATTLDVPAPRGRRLDNWFVSLRRLGSWADRDGGVGFIAQLAAAQTQTVDTLICVGLDHFPPYPDSSSLVTSFPDDVALGTIIVADLVSAKNTIMLAPQNRSLLARLGPICSHYDTLRLVAAANRYPAADPTLVAWSIAGKRQLPHGANPVARGLLLLQPWTAIRIGRWFTRQRFDIVRPTFIAWPGPNPVLRGVYALPGQSLASLDPRISQYLHRDPACVLAGNPMTGRPIVTPKAAHDIDPAAPVPDPVASEDNLLITILPSRPRPKPEPCISCGWCAQVCPTSLRPIDLAELAVNRRDDDRLMDHLSWCVDCGLCSHVCPSSLPLAQVLRQASRAMGADDRAAATLAMLSAAMPTAVSSPPAQPTPDAPKPLELTTPQDLPDPNGSLTPPSSSP